MSSATDIFDVDGRATVRSDDGVFFRVPGEPSSTLAAGMMDRVLAELAERRNAGLTPLRGREHVSIAADGPVAGELLDTLTSAGVQAQRVDPASSADCGGLLLHVPTSPAERSRFDNLPTVGTAVLRCYQEGEVVFVDPLAAGPLDPSGAQVLRRRLAASPAATELRTWLDTPAAHGFELSGASRDLLTARLLVMVKAWQTGAATLPPLSRTLWRLDTRTLTVTEHPVLPFPEPALLAGGRSAAGA
ncbi:hypothetical protein ACIPWF_16800 [Paenarthrobacter sp. NPDC089989]|uniref:hypothetical protein n=1 Tax=unclassified Paenarthrobacter TaxID=2634190 RepID=UPI0037F29C54